MPMHQVRERIWIDDRLQGRHHASAVRWEGEGAMEGEQWNDRGH